MFSALDREMMQRAIDLAVRGRYTNHPNPRVGCVVVQGERIVGEGFHRKWGEPHAEPIALHAAGAAARGATVYVTLEPHSFHGRTPPCTDALISAGVARVVCGTLDPNPKVHGNGIRQLTGAGIKVETGLLETQVRELNLGFEKRMVTGVPRIIVKIAASLDGRVALANGESRWITGEQARADVQRLRAEASAILTGIGTVLADDPRLTVRDPQIDTLGRQPLRVVLDSRGRMPPQARMLSEPGDTLVFEGPAQTPVATALQSAGAKVMTAPLDSLGYVDLAHVLQELGGLQCNDVLVEAGSTLAGRLIELGLVDELVIYIAPVLLGPQARPMVQLPQIEQLADRVQFALHTHVALGGDVKLVLRPSVPIAATHP